MPVDGLDGLVQNQVFKCGEMKMQFPGADKPGIPKTKEHGKIEINRWKNAPTRAAKKKEGKTALTSHEAKLKAK